MTVPLIPTVRSQVWTHEEAGERAGAGRPREALADQLSLVTRRTREDKRIWLGEGTIMVPDAGCNGDSEAKLLPVWQGCVAWLAYIRQAERRSLLTDE